MERYDAYDAIARIYNRHWGTFADRIYPVLHRLVLRDLRERLQNAGFEGIRTFDGDDPELEGLPDYSGRMFFVMRKA